MITLPDCKQHKSPTRFISRQAFLCQKCPRKDLALLDVNDILLSLQQHEATEMKNFKTQAQSQIKLFFQLQTKATIKKLEQEERKSILKIWWVSLYEKTPDQLKSQYFLLAEGKKLEQPSFDMLRHLAKPFLVTEEYRTLTQHFQRQYEAFIVQSGMKLNELCRQLKVKYKKRGSQEKDNLMINAASAMNDRNWTLAEHFLNETVSLDQNNLQALNRRAKCLDMQKRYELALSDYEQVQRKDENFKFIRYNIANLYFKYQLANKENEIAQLVSRQLQLTPTHAKSLVLKAFLDFRQGRLKEAENALNSCLKNCPLQKQAWVLLSKVYDKLGEKKKSQNCERQLLFYSKN